MKKSNYKSNFLTLGLFIVPQVMIIHHFGFTFTALAASVFTFWLVLLSEIDYQHHRLPDGLTLSLLWLGLLLNASHYGLVHFTSASDAVLGAAAGYLSMRCLARLFYFFTGKIGLGQGDWKLFAALGAWFGWQSLPKILAIASFVGIFVFFLMLSLGKHKKSDPIPFGPFLAFSGWITLLLFFRY
jgi:leader peptidase (prepilin peptidase)/N-methyltransferase